MAVVSLESNKAKIAKRVIEVFEFFGSNSEPATVMDIARRYGRPQSSTSELLSSLVEMGVLYKDPMSRSFKPTPRLASLGISGQPETIRDGRLFNYMEQLAQTTRKTVALFGMIGTHVQVFRWLPSPNPLSRDIGCGSSELLSNSTAGLLLLSTLLPDQARGMLWRLNAEAPADAKFDHAEMVDRVARFRQKGHGAGEAGFVAGKQMSGVMLPRGVNERPLVLGVMYERDSQIDADALIETMKHGVHQVFNRAPAEALIAPEPARFLRAV